LERKAKRRGIMYPQHHPTSDIDEDMLPMRPALHGAVVQEYRKEE
jgi:hypothetical protein